MITSLSQIAAPAVEPVTVDLVRQFIRVDNNDDDNLLALFITVARRKAENYLNRALITQQLLWSISDVPPGPQWPLTAVTPVILPLWLPFPLVFQKPLGLPRSPVQSIDQVTVSHTGQTEDTVLNAATDYTSDLTGAPARLLITPAMQPQLGQHVTVTFTAGYGDDPSLVPPEIVLAIMMGVAYLYEHRGDDGASMPEAFEGMLTPYRLVTFG